MISADYATSKAPQLTIGNSNVRQVENLYCLNDLHKASGGEDKNQPNRFLRLDTVQELIKELNSPDMGSLSGGTEPVKTVTGRNGGTYVCKELVYAYGMWISAKFHLLVIRAFDSLVSSMTIDLKTKKALPNGLTLEQCDSVKALVKARVEACPKDKQAKAAITCWSALKSKFGCTYKAIEPEHFPEALSLVARLPLEGEYLAHGEQQAAVAELPEINVREHMVGWIKSNIQLEGDLAALADEKAVSLALEFHNLAREHIARKVAYTCVTNASGLDKVKAKAAIKEVTLNKALTLKFHNAVKHILFMSQAALDLNKQYLSEMEAAISLH